MILIYILWYSFIKIRFISVLFLHSFYHEYKFLIIFELFFYLYLNKIYFYLEKYILLEKYNLLL